MVFSVWTRTGSEGSRLLREWASWRREPQIPEGWLVQSGILGAERGSALGGRFVRLYFV